MSEKSGFPGTIGARLRALRLESGISLRALARRTQFSASFLSQVESDGTSISIGSLQTIVAELGLTLSQFFSEVEASPRMVIRRSERTTFASDWSRSGLQLLTDGAADRKISAIEVTAQPGARSGTRIALRRFDTLAIMLQGAMQVTIGELNLQLEAGDAAYISERHSLSWENRSPAVATMLLVMASGKLGEAADILHPGLEAADEDPAED